MNRDLYRTPRSRAEEMLFIYRWKYIHAQSIAERYKRQRNVYFVCWLILFGANLTMLWLVL